MKPPTPVMVLELFPEIRAELLALLSSLTPEEWARPTSCAGWCVKDIAQHLLAGDIGILSRRRDAFTPPGKPIESWSDLVALINRLNETWTAAAQRMSPRVLCDLLAWTGPQVEEYFASLDPHAKGVPVDWASAEPAPVWLDLAREYTERWHHQQQIRDAVDRPGLKQRRFFAPVLEAFVHALPRTYRDVPAAEGTIVQLTITGAAGSDWFLMRKGAAWNLYVEGAPPAAARVTLDAEDAWRLFTKGLRKEDAQARAVIMGETALAEKMLDTIAIIG
ncbi:MAG: maleylpyruvate isomerase family mycothiol-dependent enzyme [Acidobacteria bacterium]|nr:maleylpyruvate isomerase family mycothiol-dependent enzyme [Acidobacteriota bacterium]